eukprot:Rmarinus@m.3752
MLEDEEGLPPPLSDDHFVSPLVKDLQAGIEAEIKRDELDSTPAKLDDLWYSEKQIYSLPSGAKFVAYAPKVLKVLRSRFWLDDSEYFRTMCDTRPMRLLGSPGKSGAILLMSANGEVFIKSTTKEEYKILKAMFRSYYHHMSISENTLIPRFFGLYRVKTAHSSQRLLVMKNIFPVSRVVHDKYDLKGSSVGRRANEGASIRKDLDWNSKLEMNKRERDSLMAQLYADVQFLQSQHVYDYSLLVGVCYLDDNPRPRGHVSSPLSAACEDSPALVDGRPARVYFGIIDILRAYTVQSRLARACKSVVFKSSEISVAPPAQYARRFKDFLHHRVFVGSPGGIHSGKKLSIS